MRLEATNKNVKGGLNKAPPPTGRVIDRENKKKEKKHVWAELLHAQLKLFFILLPIKLI